MVNASLSAQCKCRLDETYLYKKEHHETNNEGAIAFKFKKNYDLN